MLKELLRAIHIMLMHLESNHGTMTAKYAAVKTNSLILDAPPLISG